MFINKPDKQFVTLERKHGDFIVRFTDVVPETS